MSTNSCWALWLVAKWRIRYNVTAQKKTRCCTGDTVSTASWSAAVLFFRWKLYHWTVVCRIGTMKSFPWINRRLAAIAKTSCFNLASRTGPLFTIIATECSSTVQSHYRLHPRTDWGWRTGHNVTPNPQICWQGTQLRSTQKYKQIGPINQSIYQSTYPSVIYAKCAKNRHKLTHF